jgi:hypothetical protein
MAVASVHRRTRSGSNMGEKQLGLNVRGKRPQVAVVPSGKDVFE